MINYASIVALNENLIPGWVTSSFPIIRMVLVVLIALCSLILIIAVLASPANTGRGSNVITGASESFYTKHKGKNNQGRIRNLIIIAASCIAVFAVLYFVTWVIYPVQVPS